VKFVDEYRDAELGRVLSTEIAAAVEPGRHYKVMEVCGGHSRPMSSSSMVPAARSASSRWGASTTESRSPASPA